MKSLPLVLIVLAMVLVVFVLSGCTPAQFVKPDGTVASKQELAECDYEAMKATGSAQSANPMWGPSGGAYALMSNPALIQNNIKIKCLEIRGYTMKY